MEQLLWPNGAPGAQGDGQEDQPRLVRYLVEGDSTEPRAAVIVCPGGGYARRAEHEGEPVARWLNSLGIHAFVVHYRVAPYQHPIPLGDAQRAIRTVRYNAEAWGVDPGKIGILGFSAGGHLASSTAVHMDDGDAEAVDPIDRVSSRPDAAILCYPVISFLEFKHAGSKANLIGADASEELTLHMSTELQVSEQTPPIFLWHTSNDPGVPVENSLLFAAACSKHKVPFELHSFEDGKHGLGLAESHPEAHSWTQLCATWLKRHHFWG